MIEIFILAITVPFLTQHRNVVPSTEVSTNLYGSVTGIVNEAYIQSHGGGVDTNAVREIAGEVVAPVEEAVADRYTKSEADGRFVPMNFPEPYSGGFEWVPDGLALKSESVFTIPSASSLMVGGYTLGEFLSGGFWNISDNKFIRNDSFSLLSNKVEQKADKATTLSGYGITDAKIGYYEDKPFVQLGDSILYPLTSSGGSVYRLEYQEYIIGGLVRLGQDFIKLNDNEVVYGISTNGTDYAHANVNLKPWGDSLINASNPAFSNAVLSVGIDTNIVAQIGELKEFFDDLPVGTVGTSLGGIILALLAAVSWLKKNALTDGLETDGTPTDVKLDKFFTESNSLLNARIVYERNSTGLKDRSFNALTFDGAEYNLSAALASVTPTSDGQPRDLLIVATATAATTISFTAGTIKGDKPTIDGSGTWLITLTEYAANTWYCRQIKMEDAQ